MLDVLIIGCGVIGAATAYELSKYKLNLAVIEAENDVATGTTKANSAILHAGYDPKPKTLMATLNARGAKLAKEICNQLSVPYKQTGSLVLAFSEAEMTHLQQLYARGRENGVIVELLSREKTLDLEPSLSGEVFGALYAPEAAIVSPWEYALAMAQAAVQNTAELYLNTRAQSFSRENGYWLVKTNNGEFKSRFIVNACGVNAGEIHGLVGEKSFEEIPSIGEYYLLDKSEGARVSHVIFQCPNESGKGVLVAPTVHGNLIVGPNAKSGRKDDTRTTREGLGYVAEMAKKSVPGIDLRASIRNFAGVRANTNVDDFIITFAAEGFLSLVGIKSPGLTAAPAIAEYAAQLLSDNGLPLINKENFMAKRESVNFKELGFEEKAALIKQRPEYGRIICRCETITEGEIVDCLKAPIPPVSLDGVKRRVGAGMGRCQGGFCGPRVVEIISRYYGIDDIEVLQDKSGTYILTGKSKGEK